MKVGIPKEIKNHEYRVAITPAGVMELVRNGHQVVVEQDAGLGSSIPNADYVKAAGKGAPTAPAQTSIEFLITLLSMAWKTPESEWSISLRRWTF